MARQKPELRTLRKAYEIHKKAREAGNKIDSVMRVFAENMGVAISTVYLWRNWYMLQKEISTDQLCFHFTHPRKKNYIN